MRLVIAEDTVLVREGLAGLMEDAGHTVVARVGDAEARLAVVAEHEPELATRPKPHQWSRASNISTVVHNIGRG